MDASIYWSWIDWIFPVTGVILSTVGVWYFWRRRLRILNWYFLSATCWIGAEAWSEVGSMVMERNAYGSFMHWTWNVTIPPYILLRSAFALSLVAALGLTFVYVYNEWRFRKAFGVGAPKRGDTIDREIVQQLVDNKLEELADSLDFYFFQQNELRDELRERNSKSKRFSQMSGVLDDASDTSKDLVKEVKEKRESESFNRNNIAEAKKRFWATHKVADEFGFRVHSSFKDHLSSARRGRERLELMKRRERTNRISRSHGE